MPTNDAWNSENPAQVAKGGTGRSTVDAYTVVCGGTTNTNPLQNVVGTGIAGQVLTSNGPGALPIWSAGSVAPVNTTAFSALWDIPSTLANIHTYGIINTVYIDIGTNIVGNFYIVPSDGLYMFFFISSFQGNIGANYTANSNVEINGSQLYGINFCPARTLTSTNIVTAAATLFHQCNAGDTVRPIVTFFDANGVTGTSLLNGYKIF